MKTNFYTKCYSLFIATLLVFFVFTLTAHGQNSDIVSIAPIKTSIKIRGLGLVHIILNRERKFNTNTASKYYQGRAKITRDTFPVAASEINGILSVTLPGKITGSRKSRQRIYKIRYLKDLVKISSVPSSAISKNGCAEESHVVSAISSAEVKSLAQQLEAVKVATISTYTDAEWRQTYGVYANDEIVSIINAAESIYNNQLGIRFRIISQENFDDFETNPGQMLSNFRNSITGKSSANIKHLFTGKDMNGSTVGIAFIGAVCYSPEYAFGITQNYGILTSNIFAHEIGHNFGAQHDYAGLGTVMYPSISFGSIQFSDTSLYQINSFLNYFGSCLSSENLPPSLHNSKLIVSKKARTVYIKLVSENNIPIQNQTILYKIGSTKLRKGVTNSEGIIKFKINKRGLYKITATLESDTKISIKKRILIK